MSTSEEKRKFIDDLIEWSYERENSSELLNKLHGIFLRDTNDGKLYKYRTFDREGYSLKNLQDGSLHCSKPAVFNDPFECGIGIDFQSLCETKYGAEFELIDRSLEKAIKCVANEISIEECSQKEQIYIKKILDNNVLNHFINHLSTREKTLEEFMQKNEVVVVELIRMILFGDTCKEINSSYEDSLMRILEEETPRIMSLFLNNNTKLEDYARTKVIMDDEDEIGLSMLLSKQLFPEYSETIVEANELINNTTKELQEKVNSMFQVGCLCTSYKNRLMWSHYADCHRGFCVEYDFSGTEDENSNKLPLPVIYSENRPLIPWKAVIDNSEQNIKESTGELMKVLLIKDKVWEYENEWRIISGTMVGSEVKMPPISCIYLGVAIEKENRDKIVEIARKKNIVVKQMKLDRGMYDLHAEKIM